MEALRDAILYPKLAEKGGDRKSEQHQPDNVSLKLDYGNSETYTIRRLKRDRPALAEKVIAGEMSANAGVARAVESNEAPGARAPPSQTSHNAPSAGARTSQTSHNAPSGTPPTMTATVVSITTPDDDGDRRLHHHPRRRNPRSRYTRRTAYPSIAQTTVASGPIEGVPSGSFLSL